MGISVSALEPGGKLSGPASPRSLFIASRAGRAIAAQLDAEQGRWFLWLPVFFGAGIGIYFELLEEPPFSLSLGLFIAALALRMMARANLFAFLVTSILLCMSAGFFAAKLRTDIMAAPVLERHGAYDIEGFVESFDRQTPKRGRAVIRLTSMKYRERGSCEPAVPRARERARRADANAGRGDQAARHPRAAARARDARRLRFRAHELLSGHRRFGLLAVEAGGCWRGASCRSI